MAAHLVAEMSKRDRGRDLGPIISFEGMSPVT
jgi:hypothetical protein